MAPDATADEQVLSDPSAHTVEDVLAAFETATPAQVAETQELEAQGKARKSIVQWTPPADPDEPRFERDRILDPAEGPRILGYAADHHVIVGALDGDDSDDFSRTEVQAKIEAYLARPANPDEEA